MDTTLNNWKCICGWWNGEGVDPCGRCGAPNETGFCYVVVMRDATVPDALRADFKVHAHWREAQLRQMELGKLNGQPSWVMSFPDPRQVAND